MCRVLRVCVCVCVCVCVRVVFLGLVFGCWLWMDDILLHLNNPGMMIPLQRPTNNGFPVEMLLLPRAGFFLLARGLPIGPGCS